VALQVLQTIPLDDKNRRYRVWIVGVSSEGLKKCGESYIDVGTPYSWNGPTTQLQLAYDNYGPDFRITWCNLNPSPLGWTLIPAPGICRWEVMNPTFQRIQLDGSCNVVRTYLCGTYRDSSGNWGKSSGDQYVDVTSAGGVTELNFDLWQLTGSGGPENKDYYGIWISNTPSAVDWYGDVKICGWECIPAPAPPLPPCPGVRCPS
jgi:hypothetical protein